MKRRDFITLLGGAAMACPLAARAQQPAMPRDEFGSTATALSFQNDSGPSQGFLRPSVVGWSLQQTDCTGRRGWSLLAPRAQSGGRSPVLDVRRREFITLLGGATAAWPLAARGQQPTRSYRISFLALVPGEDRTLMQALLERLRELGYSEGTNMSFKYRSAEGRPERLAPLAMELVQDKPDVLVAGFGTLAAQAAKAATTSIPVVFTTVGDPLGAGIIASLARPGGNVTGLTDQARDVQGKRLQLLQELIPGKHDIAVLLNPDTPFSQLALEEAKAAAEYGHIHLVVFEVRAAEQVSEKLEDAAKSAVAGLLILEDPVIYSARGKIADLSARFRLPAIYVYKDSVEAGGLMSYGPDRRHIYRRAAEYVDKILKGTKPADLAVEQPTKFEFVINLKTAKALGLQIPDRLLALADEVIE